MVHLIANSHIDPVWLWDRYEGTDEVLNTFRSAADRLDEYPDLKFSAGSVQFYEWVYRLDRALFQRIAAHVVSGRWEIVGGFWVEPDTNLPLKESFAQHRRLADQFVRSKFAAGGSDVAYLPDSFGHPADLPAILADLGFRYFIFCRPGEHEKADLPGNLFHWEYQGRRVLAYRLKFHYLQPQPDGNEAELRRRLADPEVAERPSAAFFFGLGDHGGGPTIREIEFYRSYIAASEGDIKFSTCREFFRDAEQTPGIPTYSGDLHMHAVGCYSVVREIKDSVRRAERALLRADRAAHMTGEPTGGLDEAWRTTLFNQFHDILPGSCAPSAAAQALDALGGVHRTARDVSYRLLKQHSSSIPPACPTGEFRIYNSLTRPVTVPLSIESFLYFRPGAVFRDETGKAVELQEVMPAVRCVNRRWAFVDTLPASGFKSYHFDENGADPRSVPPVHFTPAEAIDFSGVRVGVDGVIDTRSGAAPIAVSWLLLNDASDTWGHGVRAYADVAGTFVCTHSAASTGPVAHSLYQRFELGRSSVDVVWTKYAALPGVYADVAVRWGQDRAMLKLQFSRGGGNQDRFIMRGAAGTIARKPSGEELPLHGWVRLDAEDRASGFAVVQDGAFACDCAPGRLRLTLVRSSVFAHHDPYELDPNDPQAYTDQGVHRFTLLIRPEPGVDALELDRCFDELVEELPVIREGGRTPSD